MTAATSTTATTLPIGYYDAAKEAAGLDVVRKMPGLAEFRRLEAIVLKGLATYLEVGEALERIRAHRLWRDAGYMNFATCVRECFGITSGTAYRQIKASEIAKLLPNGNIPKTEAQARELVNLEPEHLKAVAEVIDLKTSTAIQIRRAVHQVVNAQPPDCPDPIRELNLKRLHKILKKEPTLALLFDVVGEIDDGLVEEIQTGKLTVCAAIGILLPELIVREDRWRAAEQK